MDMRTRLWALAIIIALTAPVSACASSAFPEAKCVPRVLITPSVAAPGEVITLTSDTECQATVPPGGWRIVAAHVGREPAVSVTTTERFDGDFEVTLTLPNDFPEGEAYAGVDNWDYSFCNDTNASCASATGDFTVTR